MLAAIACPHPGKGRYPEYRQAEFLCGVNILPRRSPSCKLTIPLDWQE